MQERIKILEEKVLCQSWATFKKYKIQYKNSNGIHHIQDREILDSGDGAAVLLYNLSLRKIILIRQFRLPVFLNSSFDAFILECCAGLTDDITPDIAIIKEIKEETGYIVPSVTKIYEAFASPGVHLEKIHFFVAQYDPNHREGEGGGLQDEQEDIEVVEFSIDEIPKLLQSGQIIDCKTMILLQWAMINL